jgi:SLBB domain
MASLRPWLAMLLSGPLGLERLAWFGAGLSAGAAAWLAGEVALGPLLGGHPPPPPRPTPPPVRVQVDGAVQRPGVYDLTPGARVEDALRAAGGLAEDGDPGELNLVARVADGQRIAVPVRAPPASDEGVPATPTPSDRPRPTSPSRDRPRLTATPRDRARQTSVPRDRPRPMGTPRDAPEPVPPADARAPDPPEPLAVPAGAPATEPVRTPMQRSPPLGTRGAWPATGRYVFAVGSA